MRKNKFYMTIGLPGCGKSTWADRQGLTVHSSDSIREEFVGKGQYKSIDEVPNGEVFEIMQNRTIKSLTKGESVVYDATSISRKDRKQILDRVRRLGIERVAVLFLVPVSVCKDRNRKRERTVPEFVYDKMLKRFDVPMLGAEFEDILFHEDGKMNERERELCSFSCRETFDQHSPFHTLTVGEHLSKTRELYLSEKYIHPEFVLEAAKLHDFGKPHTFFIGDDGKGHFYGHENVGAYWYLVALGSKRYKTAVLINWHMRPYAWEKSDKAKLRDLELIDRYDPDMYGQLMAISKADRRAH